MGMSRILVASICAVLVLLGACTDSPDQPRPEAAFASTSCPDDVDIVVVPPHSCGYVTTRLAGGDVVRLFVLQVEPPTPSTQPPIIETGSDLGTQASYGGLAPIPQRTGRRLIVVDLQGTGHSTPLLDCPEVNALAATSAADPDGSSAAVVDAIKACRARLTSQGIDPADFDVASTAEDLHAVAQALAIPRSVAMGHGTTGAVSIEWARRYPDEVEALVLDSPQLVDPTSGTVVDRLVTEVSRLCAAAADCRRRYGDTAAKWPGLLRDLARRPLVLSADGQPIRLDDDALRRAVLWLAGGGDLGANWIPALVAESISRRPGNILSRYAEALAAGPPLCVGYLPRCAGVPAVAVGAALSLNCPLVLHDPGWRKPCRAWGATVPANPPDQSLDTPTLVLMGRYDAFAPPHDVRASVADQIPGAYFVEDPAGAHNVLGGDCVRSVRSVWLAGSLTSPPPTPTCLRQRKLVFK
jgi:pimeloyl-ACP methyl ester carboxylesterase